MMKRNFLGRKNKSLFDTDTKIKNVDKDNVELVLESPPILESGTASVRARPTVKHLASSNDTFQAFPVPTPKVPVLPSVNGPKTNGSVGGDHFFNGSVLSLSDPEEEEIFVPPPPSMAPPPPPSGSFIPPPDFMGDLNSLNLAALQPIQQTTLLAPFMEGEDLTFMKPPPMAPPKPPSTSSSGSLSSTPISASSPLKVPEHPTFSPPQPPSERQHKTHKQPPPKPIRQSSISTFDSPPETPAPPPPAPKPTLSTFNPQNAAKLYYVPQTSILSGYEEHEPRPKQMLVLEDSTSVNSAPVLVQVDGKVSKVASPSKAAPRDVQELMENLRLTKPLSEPTKEATTGITSAQPEMDKLVRTPQQTSPQLQKQKVNAEPDKDKLDGSPGQTHLFSSLIDCKLRNLKSSETSNARDAPAASPLALLMAAKERDKYKSSHSLSRGNSTKANEQTSPSIHPSDSSPNSFIITPRSSSCSSLTSLERTQESPKSVSPMVQTDQTPVESSSLTLVKDQIPSVSSALSRMDSSPSVTTSLVEEKLNAAQSPSKSQPTQPEELNMPLLPPPPEFDDFEDSVEPPPSIPPPDPPNKKAPIHPPSHIPPPPPKLKPPAAPKLPPPDIIAKPKLQIPMKSKAAPAQVPSPLSPSQATLLSILQKKMLEMDNKMAPAKETESMSDDWGTPLPEEYNKVPVFPTVTPQNKTYSAVNKETTLNMQELESKVIRRPQETSPVASPVRPPTCNGTQSKHQYGMTFTVRPGTKQPITLVSKGDP